jgi:hypothetical protein
MDAGTQDTNNSLNDINEKRTSLRNKIQKCRAQKGELKEEHYGKLLDFEL